MKTLYVNLQWSIASLLVLVNVLQYSCQLVNQNTYSHKLKTGLEKYCSVKTSHTVYLKENCNAKTSWFHLKGRSKSFKMRPKSLKSVEPFSRYSALKIEIWTILREKTTEKPKMLFFLEVLRKLKNNRFCDVRNDKCTIQQCSVSNISICSANTSLKFYGWTVWHIWNTTVIFVVTMVTIWEQKHHIWKQRKCFCVEMLLF